MIDVCVEEDECICCCVYKFRDVFDGVFRSVENVKVVVLEVVNCWIFGYSEVG